MKKITWLTLALTGSVMLLGSALKASKSPQEVVEEVMKGQEAKSLSNKLKRIATYSWGGVFDDIPDRGSGMITKKRWDLKHKKARKACKGIQKEEKALRKDISRAGGDPAELYYRKSSFFQDAMSLIDSTCGDLADKANHKKMKKAKKHINDVPGHNKVFASFHILGVEPLNEQKCIQYVKGEFGISGLLDKAGIYDIDLREQLTEQLRRPYRKEITKCYDQHGSAMNAEALKAMKQGLSEL